MVDNVKLYPVIMAGGSGTRFWPLSRRKNPKQFLPLVSKRPLIAETADRLKGLAPLKQSYVVCGPLHAKGVLKSVKGLPKANVVVEPVARNTAPAIGLATLRVAQKDPDAVLVVLPSDQHVADVKSFQAALQTAAQLAEQGHIVTLGIKPTRPETGYGYIHQGAPLAGGGFTVRAFKEKPDVATAAQYMASGDYLWNAGIFVFQAKTMLDAIAEHAPELSKGLKTIAAAKKAQATRVLGRVFPKLPNISVDYAVMERAKNIAVVPADCGWSDVGSFAALPDVRAADKDGNVVVGMDAIVIDSKGCIVVANKRPLAVVGMTDAVVVDAGDAVLVVPKDQSQEVRKVVEALKARKLERYL